MSDLKKQRSEEGAIVPAAKRALVNGGSSVSGYLAAHGVGMSGTFFKFDGKEKKFVKAMDGEEIAEGRQFVVVYDQIQAGWIKFQGKGESPIRKQGSIFEGYVPPARETLGEMDESEWELGLSGKPADPWQFQILIPMQAEDGELYVFQAGNQTSRRVADALIAACGRMEKTEPDQYPIYRLRIAGFAHRDPRVGWVSTPALDRVGKAPKADTTMTDTSLAGELNDEIPW